MLLPLVPEVSKRPWCLRKRSLWSRAIGRKEAPSRNATCGIFSESLATSPSETQRLRQRMCPEFPQNAGCPTPALPSLPSLSSHSCPHFPSLLLPSSFSFLFSFIVPHFLRVCFFPSIFPLPHPVSVLQCFSSSLRSPPLSSCSLALLNPPQGQRTTQPSTSLEGSVLSSSTVHRSLPAE